MKLLILFLTIGLSTQALAIKQLQLNSIGFGNLLHLTGTIELPKVHRLNKGAPSKIDVFEKEKGAWVLTEKVSLNDFFSLTELIRFQKPIHLRSERSDVKLGISVYHCPEDHKGLCVIDDFEGLIKRSSSKVTSEVTVSIHGTDPTKY